MKVRVVSLPLELGVFRFDGRRVWQEGRMFLGGMVSALSGWVNEIILQFVGWGRKVGAGVSSGESVMSGGLRGEKRKFFVNRKIGYGLVVLILVLLIAGVIKVWGGFAKGGVANGQVAVLGAKASEDVGKEFSFPLKNSKGQEVSAIKFLVDKAELRDEIIVKGQKATAVQGRTFLIINLKISNEHNQRIEIDTRDYIRLSVNGNTNEWLAPDIHNDPVEVQAISTKYTRVGFPINSADRNLILRIGEITGEKTEIPLTIL